MSTRNQLIMCICSSTPNFRTIKSANTSATMRHATSYPSSPEAESLPGQRVAFPNSSPFPKTTSRGWFSTRARK